MTTIAMSDLSNTQLVAIHNLIANPAKPVKRFENRATAEARVAKALETAGIALEAACVSLGIIEGVKTEMEAERGQHAAEVAAEHRQSKAAEDEEGPDPAEQHERDTFVPPPGGWPEADESMADEIAAEDEDEQSAEAIMRRNAERLAAAAAEKAEDTAGVVRPGEFVSADSVPQAEDLPAERQDNAAPCVEGDVLIEGDTASTAERVAQEAQEDGAGLQDESEGEEAQYVFSLPCTPVVAHRIALALAKLADAPVKYTACECSAISGGKMVEPPKGKAKAATRDEPKKVARTPKAKPERKAEDAGPFGLNGKKLALFNLMTRENGVTEKEGCDALGWAACTATIIRVAQAAATGYDLRKDKDADKRTRYRLVERAEAAAA